MPITFACTKCNHNMRVPDNVVGKRVKCPKCHEVLRVPDPAEETKPATEDMWHVKIEDGDTYGPVSKSELDEWVDEGRVTAKTQILKQGTDQWQWAAELYQDLEEPPPPPEPAPVKPTPVITVDAGKDSPTPAGAPVIAVDTGKDSPGPAAAPIVAVDTGKDTPSPPAIPVVAVDKGKDRPSPAAAPVVAKDIPSPTAAPVGPSVAATSAFGVESTKTTQTPFRSRVYPAMDLASRIYRILGWVVIVVVGLGTLGYLFNVVRTVTAISEAGGAALVVVLGTSLLFLAVGLLYAAITVITLWFAADAIKCILDIQNNTHRSNHYLQQLSEKQEEN